MKSPFMSRKKIIKCFAEHMAKMQKNADIQYYERNNKDMSSYYIEKFNAVLPLIVKLGIIEEAYEEAYKLYDFRNSNKAGYWYIDGVMIELESKYSKKDN